MSTTDPMNPTSVTLAGACPPEENLSAYLDGDLDAQETTSVEGHLDACTACQGILDELSDLTRDLNLMGQVDLPRDLWPGIVEAHEAQTRGWRGWLQANLRWMGAASLGAAAAAAALVLWLPPMGSDALAEAELNQRNRDAVAQAYLTVLDAENTYAAAIEALEGAVQQGSEEMDPEIEAAMKEGLAAIDKTIALCRGKLKEDPNDFSTRRTLLAAYEKKVDLLREFVGSAL